jgi:hypothetical protein
MWDAAVRRFIPQRALDVPLLACWLVQDFTKKALRQLTVGRGWPLRSQSGSLIHGLRAALTIDTLEPLRSLMNGSLTRRLRAGLLFFLQHVQARAQPDRVESQVGAETARHS